MAVQKLGPLFAHFKVTAKMGNNVACTACTEAAPQDAIDNIKWGGEESLDFLNIRSLSL